MSDQQPPAQQDTAAVAGPNEAPGSAQDQPQQYSQVQEDVDWHKRYVDTQADYTRQQQEFAQKQQWYDLLVTAEDPDTRRQAAEALGYEFPEEEDPEELNPAEYEDPYEQLDARQRALEEQFQQSQQTAQQQAEFDLMNGIVNERLDAIEGLTDKSRDWVLAYAINALPPIREPGVPVPLPDLNQAVEAWREFQTEEQKSWAKTKRAPRVMPGGVTANEVPDPGTGHTSRMNRAMQFLHDNSVDE